MSPDNGQRYNKQMEVCGRTGGNGRQCQTVSNKLSYGLGLPRIADEAVHLMHLAILHGIAVMGGVTVVDIAVATALLLYKTDLLRMMMMATPVESNTERVATQRTRR